MDKIRVALFDDHPLMVDGIVRTLAAEWDFIVVREGACAADAVRCARSEKPDLILLDIQMPGGGLTAARVIVNARPKTKIVIFTVSKDPQNVSAAIAAGVHGYVLKGVGGPELTEILRAVHKGLFYLAPEIAAHHTLNRQHVNSDGSITTDKLDDLTAREKQVLKFVAQGMKNREIAQQLDLTEKTVKYYISLILQKLRVRNRVEAVLVARHYAIKTREYAKPNFVGLTHKASL